VGFTSSFDTSSLENGSLLSDLNTKGLNILPVTKFTNWESFLSGTAISMTSGFWFAIAFAGVKLQRPYKYKAYRILQWSFYLQVFFFALSFNSIFSEHKSIFNPGTLGSALTILFTVPIYQISRKRTVRLWSQEYVPPLPEITEP
jgi:hypothetical protein